jgi:hypothetical protein
VTGCKKWYNSSRRCGVPVKWVITVIGERRPGGGVNPQPACPGHLTAVIEQVFSLGYSTEVSVTKAEGPR